MAQNFVEVWSAKQEAITPRNEEKSRLPYTLEGDIRSVLESYGIQKETIEDHGHVLIFPYQGLVVEVVDQDTRLVGKIHKKPTSELEVRCLQDANSILRSDACSVEEREQFLKEFAYRAFVFNGRPAEAIHDVMELAHMSVEGVLKLYREGYERSGSKTYGPIHDVPTTWIRVMNSASAQNPKSIQKK